MERKQRLQRIIAAYLAISILAEVASPTVALALTSGPAQPEMQSFEPVGTTEMVDLFSGDFNYNIPLLTVPGPNGGYPVNLAYHSGIGMEEEASWVGLGWNINAGVITRELRGLPDDFNGDKVTKSLNLRPSRTLTLGYSSPTSVIKNELLGGFQLQVGSSYRLTWNNYQGIGFSAGAALSVTKGPAKALKRRNAIKVRIRFEL